MINDYALYHDNPVDEARRRALLKLVERLKAKGTPLDMVGIQGHLELAKGAIVQERLARLFRDLADTGVTLALTEVDVLEADRTLPLIERDARVAAAFNSLIEVARAEPAMTSITTWGLSIRVEIGKHALYVTGFHYPKDDKVTHTDPTGRRDIAEKFL